MKQLGILLTLILLSGALITPISSLSVYADGANTVLTMSSNATNVFVGKTINFTYTEQNTGNVPLSDPTVTDNSCSTVVSHTDSSGFNIGDVNQNNILDPSESWTFQCIQQQDTAGTITHTATGDGTDSSGTHITAPAYPSEQTSLDVTVNTVATSIPSATGAGDVSFSTSTGQFTSASAVSESSLTTPPPTGSYPFGFFSWTVTGVSIGGTATITFNYPSDPGTVYEKLIGTTWYAIPVTKTANPDGTYTVSMTLTDGAAGQDADGIANGQITDPGAMGTISASPLLSQKNDIISSLQALSPTDKKDTNDLTDAIKKLVASVDPKLWQSDNLNPKEGEKVFNFDKDSVKKLMDMIKHGKESSTLNQDIQDAIGGIVTIDKTIASQAIDKASTMPGNDASHKVSDAQKEMDKASDEFSKGNFDKAIDHYKNAWKKAQEVIKK